MTVKRVVAVLMWTVYPLSGDFMRDMLKTPGSGSCVEKKPEGRPGGKELELGSLCTLVILEISGRALY